MAATYFGALILSATAVLAYERSNPVGSLSLSAATSLQVSVAVNHVRLAGPLSLAASGSLSVTQVHVLRPVGLLDLGLVATLTITDSSVSGAGGAITARHLLSDVLNLWGGCPDTADTSIQQEAVNVVNAAMQFLHAHGKELPYLTKRTRVYAVQADTGFPKAIELETDVQHVDGCVRAVTPYWKSVIAHKSPGAPIGMPRGSLFVNGAKITLGWSALDDPQDYLIYRSHFTDVETLRKALQARTLNGATCFVHDAQDYFVIAWDFPPKWAMTFPIAGAQIATPPNATFTIVDSLAASFTSAVPSYDSSVQTELALTPVADRWQFDNWAALYGADAGLCYFLERTHTPLADAARARLLLSSNGAGPGLYSVDVAIEPARISWSDYRNGTVVPIPHRYVESLLMPIARYRATASHRYRQKERHANIMQQYQEALTMLGVVDPQTAAVDGKEGEKA